MGWPSGIVVREPQSSLAELGGQAANSFKGGVPQHRKHHGMCQTQAQSRLRMNYKWNDSYVFLKNTSVDLGNTTSGSLGLELPTSCSGRSGCQAVLLRQLTSPAEVIEMIVVIVVTQDLARTQARPRQT